MVEVVTEILDTINHLRLKDWICLCIHMAQETGRTYSDGPVIRQLVPIQVYLYHMKMETDTAPEMF
jgi:hypothetical protein